MQAHHYALVVFLVIVFYTDVRKAVVPNRLTFGGIIAGFLYHLIVAGHQGLLFSLGGFAAGFVIMLVIYLFGGVGAGDVKLFGAIGAISGLNFVLYCMAYTIIYSGAIGIVLLLWNRNLLQRMYQSLLLFYFFLLRREISDFQDYKKQVAVRFPLMYAVLPGALTALFYLR